MRMSTSGAGAWRRAWAAGWLAVAVTPALAQEVPVPDLEVAEVSVHRVDWIAGCWGADDRETGSGEFWILTQNDVLLGLGRTVRGGETKSYEFMQIDVAGDRLIYTAEPQCQEPTRFVQARIGDAEVVFENGEHDFPQRVSYRLVAPGRLLARIEGEVDGERRSVDFPMTRQDCSVLGAMPGTARD